MTVGRSWANNVPAGMNLLPPGLAVVVGAALALAGSRLIGAGIAIGGCLALLNSAMLLRRVGLAAGTGNPFVSMVAMQAGLLVTFTSVAAITVIMVLISVPMTVAMGISFFITQTLELIVYARTRNSKVDADPGFAGLEEDRI